MASGTVANQTPVSMGFPRQEYWRGLPFPPPGDLPDPGSKLLSLASSVRQVDSLQLYHLGSPDLTAYYKGTSWPSYVSTGLFVFSSSNSPCFQQLWKVDLVYLEAGKCY